MTFRPVVRNPLLATSKGSSTAAFKRPDLAGAKTPETCDLAYCTLSGGINLDGWYIARIKRTPGVKYTVNQCFGPVAVGTAGTTWAVSIYQFVIESGFTRLKRIAYSGEFPVAIGEVVYQKIPSSFLGAGLALEPEKHYAFCAWTGSAASAVTSCYSIPELGGGASSNFFGRAYSATESSDQMTLLLDAADPGPGLLMSMSKERVLWAVLGTAEDSSYMF